MMTVHDFVKRSIIFKELKMGIQKSIESLFSTNEFVLIGINHKSNTHFVTIKGSDCWSASIV